MTGITSVFLSVMLFMCATDISCVAQGMVVSPMSSEHEEETPKAQEPTQLLSLRIRIDHEGNMQVLDRIMSSGVWNDDRGEPLGDKFFFAVKDGEGKLLASGYRKDPRGLNIVGKRVVFLLTVPYDESTKVVEIYKVSYEDGGSDAYVRNYNLMASFDVAGLGR